MSDDDFSDPYDEPSMEISIETLTGTSFDMRVYPTDTVLDIKNKIQRVEGIPAHHQNLLFQLKELQDFKRLCDIGIVNGSKLKLVLSMRGGPISTRRMSTCDHHIVWKDLKDLIEHTREEIGDKTGSKVSVLVFKEGDVINLIRVIENEDGSYSPYADKTITPPYRSSSERESTQVSFFKKISEDMEMASKMHTLKSKMQNLSVKRHLRGKCDKNKCKSEMKSKSEENAKRNSRDDVDEFPRKFRSRFAYKLFNDRKIEGKVEHDDVEIALKEKHRSKKISSLDKKRKSFDSREFKISNVDSKVTNVEAVGGSTSADDLNAISDNLNSISENMNPISNNLNPILKRYSRTESMLKSRRSLYDNDLSNTKISEPIAILEDDTNNKDLLTSIEVPCSETLSLSARNRVHLTQFFLQDSETKSSSESLELEDSSELWEIDHEPIKKSATYPVSLVKRRASVDHSYDSDLNIETASNINLNDDYNSDIKKSDYELLGRNFYNLPQYVSTPSAIPHEYAPKNGRICAVYLGGSGQEKSHRSPLYGRRTRLNKETVLSNKEGIVNKAIENVDVKDSEGSSSSSSSNNSSTTGTKHRTKVTVSNIERLCNDFVEGENPKSSNDLDDILGFYNSKSINELDKFLNMRHSKYRNSTSRNQLEKTDNVDNKIETEKFEGSAKQNLPKLENYKLENNFQRLENFQKIESFQKLETLPSLNKKRMRCEHCNKRLNITNIYNCRCGRIFCSQHRYSEVHDCKYDYKTEGRKILEQQNPLVTANKLPKF